ncbi:MAG: TetR/AcrR family transcriptional regulator [Alphaproteobacteria bacterium]|nr:TetR/AcrR family transcriptional regulator [Alphaproteobacteria bacterium]
MTDDDPTRETPPRSLRADAARNREALLSAAGQVFVASGVDAPIREIAAAAGVGIGTIYRHFPKRSDLIVAVYRHQIEGCAAAGPALLAEAASPLVALRAWCSRFVDFLATKHGLAGAMGSDASGYEALHRHFIDRLVPVCARLIAAAAEAGEIRADVRAYELMRAIGNLCIGGGPDYDPRRMVTVLLDGLAVGAGGTSTGSPEQVGGG